VADSIPERELEETRWKAAQLAALVTRAPVAANLSESQWIR